MALAGSLFFSIEPGAARSRVALYLLLTVAPFAVVAPLLSPVIDRSRGGRRALIIAGAASRAIVCVSMATHLDSLMLFPEAFAVLVLSKTHMIAKSALVPSTVSGEGELVAANSRLAVLSVVAGFLAAIPGIVVLKVGFLGSDWVVRLAALGLRRHRRRRVPPGPAARRRRPPAADGRRGGRAARGVGAYGGVGHGGAAGRRRLPHLPDRLRLPPRRRPGLVVRRGPRRQHGRVVHRRRRGAQAAPAPGRGAHPAGRRWPWWWGRVCWRRGSAVCPPPPCWPGPWAWPPAPGKLAFDSIVQRDAPDAIRGRTFARFETRFQLAWVAGAALPVAVRIPSGTGMGVLALTSALALSSYLAGLRAFEHHRNYRVPERRFDALGTSERREGL